MECWSATRKNEILLFAIAWMDLANTMLSKISQTEKARTIRFYSYVGDKTESNK